MSIAFDVKNLPDDYIINTRRRHEFQNKSWWYRQTHSVEEKVVNYEFYNFVIAYFDRAFNINDHLHTARLWHFALKTHNISWSKEEDFTAEKFKRIYLAFKRTVICSGPGIECSIHSTRDYLLAKTKEMSFSSLRWENWRRVLVEKDEARLTKFRGKIEKALNHGLESYKSGKVPEEIFTGFVYNILSFIPFTYPPVGTVLKIPTKIDGEWKVISYKVDTQFELSPAWFSTPLPSFGLLSETEGAPPMIVSIGTTYPAGEGFIASIFSDFTPGFSVGHAPSLYGHAQIKAWLEGKKGVFAIGPSLGGSISLHLARQHPEAISQVYAFNPAGLYPCNWSGIDHSSTQFAIYSNENDVVSTMGYLPEGNNVRCYRVMAQECENFLKSHTSNYHAEERVTLVRTSASYENSRFERKFLTILHMVSSPLLFLVLLPVHLIYAICHFIYQQISRLCYGGSSSNQEGADAELFRSGTERHPTGLSEGAV